MVRPISRLVFAGSLLTGVFLGSQAYADDLDYIDKRFPYQNLSGTQRLKQAAKCTKQGDGRCFMTVVAEIVRNFRKYDEVNPILKRYNLGYFVNAINQWEYQILGRRDNYVFLSQAIYYGHTSVLNGDCDLDDFLGFNGPLSNLDDVKMSLCETAQCKEDVRYYVRGFQNFYRNYCQR